MVEGQGKTKSNTIKGNGITLCILLIFRGLCSTGSPRKGLEVENAGRYWAAGHSVSTRADLPGTIWRRGIRFPPGRTCRALFGGEAFDFYQGGFGEGFDGYGAAGGEGFCEELGIDFVHGGEV